MSWQRKMRPVVLVAGLGLAIGSLVGARALTHGTEPPAKGEPAPAPRAAGGTIVLGTVDSDPQPIDYRLPAVLQSGTVAEVFVKEGAAVRAGDKLYAFDDAVQRANVKKAKTAVDTARTKVKEAGEAKKQHANKIEVTKKGVEALERQASDALKYSELVKRLAEQSYKTNKFPVEEWPAKLNDDPDYLAAQSKYTAAYNALDVKKAELKALETADLHLPIEQAEAVVAQAEAEQALAQTMVDMCVVKAQVAGTVEHVSISPGATLGISTRTPALWLLPAGPRVVRGEVEAEFAHKFGPNLVNKTVTITDHSDPKLTYTGTVRRISDAFLLKRATAENFLGGDTRVIEAVIDVPDPAPAGKPPLRVGQRVRVNMGQ